MSEEQARMVPGWELSEASVRVMHHLVYANGVQQALVRIGYIARLGTALAKLTETEKASIRLINYATEAPLGLDPASADPQPHWLASRTYSGFLYHPQAKPELSPDRAAAEPRDESDYIEFFVSATDGAGASPMQLAFEVTRDDGARFLTTGFAELPLKKSPTHERVPRPYIDTHRGHEVTAEPPMLFPPENFRLSRHGSGRTNDEGFLGTLLSLLSRLLRLPGVDVVEHSAKPKAPVFDEQVELTLIGQSGALLPLRTMTCTPAGMIHWQWHDANVSNPCFIGYAAPGNTSITWNADVPPGSQPLPDAVAKRNDRGVIVLCGRIDIPFVGHETAPQGPVDVEVVDAYGSLQAFRLAFIDGKRDQLEIR